MLLVSFEPPQRNNAPLPPKVLEHLGEGEGNEDRNDSFKVHLYLLSRVLLGNAPFFGASEIFPLKEIIPYYRL
jgi:hypothetical protein